MSKKRVGLLYDSLSDNAGDEAMGIALAQVLEPRGIETEVVDPLAFNSDDYDKIIIGGGLLLRDPGDKFYDLFRLKGRHILNGVGVETEQDVAYLNEYDFVSSRSPIGAALLEKGGATNVKVIPCMTTLIKSEPYDLSKYGITDDEVIVGIHVVPETFRVAPGLIETINAIPHKKVFMTVTHYNLDGDFMKHMPFDKSNAVVIDDLTPLELHGLIGRMKYVVVSSLHATIFAYSQNIPFASMRQEKVERYFTERGLGEWVFRDDAELQKLIAQIEDNPPDYTEALKRDKKILKRTVDQYVKIIQATPEKKYHTKPVRRLSPQTLELIQELERLHLSVSVRQRDILLHELMYRTISAEHALALSEHHLKATKKQLIRLQAEMAEVRATAIWRAVDFIRKARTRMGDFLPLVLTAGLGIYFATCACLGGFTIYW